MRILLLVLIALSICSNSFANKTSNENDTSLMKIVDTIFLNFAESMLTDQKYCRVKYKKGGADVDVWDYRFQSIFLKGDGNFVKRLFKYLEKFCSDSASDVKNLEAVYNELKSEKFTIEFYYKRKNNKTSDIICSFYGSDEYCVLNLGYQDDYE